MTARRKWRTVFNGAEKIHTSERGTYQWIHTELPKGTIVRVYIDDGTGRWDLYETVEANG